MTIYVSPDGDLWKIQWEKGSVISRHFTQTTAIKAARELVSHYSRGYITQVVVQRPDGRFREEWTYGRDPFPPRG
jgi:hypothetical protein